MCVCVCMCACMCVCVCVHVCMHVCVCVCGTFTRNGCILVGPVIYGETITHREEEHLKCAIDEVMKRICPSTNTVSASFLLKYAILMTNPT